MPKQVDHRRRRDEIAVAVWRLVAEGGMGAVTLRSIATAADISVGRIQHYFPTREAIVRYGLEAMISRAAESFGESTRESDPRSALAALLIHSIPRTDERRLGATVWYAYIAESVASPAVAELLRTTLQGLEDLVTTMIPTVREPDVDRTADRALARMLLAAADGIVYRVLVGQLSEREADDAIQGLVDLVCAPARPS